MAEFTVRSDSVNVEQIMEQIRARIREKRGVDYTEEQIHELAKVKLEKFLEPKGLRSDLLDEFKRTQPRYQPPELPNYKFEEDTLFESHRGIVVFFRKLLRPILKLFFNPNPLIQSLHIQSRLNTMVAEREATREGSRVATDRLYYEVIHNLVLETTRLGIEVKNLRMRVDSLTGRMEFNERRARALESAVVYKAPDVIDEIERSSTPSISPAPTGMGGPPAGGQAPSAAGSPETPGQRSRRRRRRRGRRGGAPAVAVMGGGAPPSQDAGSAVSQPSPDPAAPAPDHGADTAGSQDDRSFDADAGDDSEPDSQ